MSNVRKMNETSMDELKKAVTYFGSRRHMAAATNLEICRVNQFFCGFRPIPAKTAVELEYLSKGKIKCNKLLNFLLDEESLRE